MTPALMHQLIRQALKRARLEGLSATEIAEQTGLARERVLREVANLPEVQALPRVTRATAPTWHEESVWIWTGGEA